MHLVIYTGGHYTGLTPLISWPLLIGAGYGFIRFLMQAIAFVVTFVDEARKNPGDSVPPAWRPPAD